MKKSFLYIFIVLFISCAEIIAPSGGKKDTQAPIVKDFKPVNKNTNFKGNVIELKFDEFIKFNASSNNILISPLLKKKPKYELLGKKLKITFQEELKKNTTYIIKFGKSIKDYNEGNEIKDLTYIFSTGDFIDSLKVSGVVKNAFNLQYSEEIIVGLYNYDEDSILYKKPSYIALTNNEGKFEIKNIKEGKYKIAALEDNNLNYIFDQQSEKLAFLDTVFNIATNLRDISLFIFENKQITKMISFENKQANHIVFKANHSFIDIKPTISNQKPNEITYSNINKTAFHYWYNNKKTETNFTFESDENNIDSFNIELKNNTIDSFEYTQESRILNNRNIIELNFPFPITIFLENKFFVKNKSKLVKYSNKWINNKQTLQIQTAKLFDTLIIETNKACFTSFHNKTNTKQLDTLSHFKENTSSLIVNLNNKTNKVIELYDQNNNLLKKQIVSHETQYIFKDLKLGKYHLRIYIDSNQDKTWNTGMFHVKQQAEKTILYKEIELKDNWDKVIEIK